MSTHLHNFRCWYSNILDGLYANDNAGFVILMVAFPLLERYLRERSGIHEGDLTAPFYDELRHIFPVLRDTGVACKFWHVYRNGLLHQVTLSQQDRRGSQMPEGWLRSDVDPVTIGSGGEFSVHPETFAKTVIRTIEADFTTFEGTHSVSHPLPIIHATSAGTSSAAEASVPLKPVT